jgi:hypothetical protein
LWKLTFVDSQAGVKIMEAAATGEEARGKVERLGADLQRREDERSCDGGSAVAVTLGLGRARAKQQYRISSTVRGLV